MTTRPSPSEPRGYDFPRFVRNKLSSGFEVIGIDVPDRPLGAAFLLLEAGAAYEQPGQGGVAALTARAITEGTHSKDAVTFTEATERIGADVHAESEWDSFKVVARAPMSRLEMALELLAEAVRTPEFPEREIERLKKERLNRLMQEWVDPASRAQHAFLGKVYTDDSTYSRPEAGSFETVTSLNQQKVAGHFEKLAAPTSATLIVAGDLDGFPLMKIAESLFGDWRVPEPDRGEASVKERIEKTSITLVHRPGSVQSQLLMGHVGVERTIPDFLPVVLMATATGGLFDSRLNMKLREEKGYTYGARVAYDFRRLPGPFHASAAVHTEVTAAAVTDTVDVLTKTKAEGITPEELEHTRNWLVGVFPLRFETPESVASAVATLVTYGLPNGYYDNYRSDMEKVTLEEVNAAASRYLRPERSAIVVVGDADRIASDLEKTGLGDVEIVEDPPPGSQIRG